jgi:ribokinase
MLLDRGVGAVAIQAGLEGSLLVWRDGEHFFSRIAIDTVDATGAGDAFAGALAASLAREKSLVEAVMFANGAAALATTKLGAHAGLPKEAALKEFVSRTPAEELAPTDV